MDCEVPAHGVTAVYGPSGSGKSTLLDCIAGLRQPEPDSVVRLGDTAWQEHGHNTPPWKRGIAYVFQDARLFPHLNVLQNLQYGMKRQSSRTADKLDILSTGCNSWNCCHSRPTGCPPARNSAWQLAGPCYRIRG